MDKRTFLKITGAAGAGLVLTPWMGCEPKDAQSGSTAMTTFGPESFKLPELGFSLDALSPSIDALTMEIHHGKHHAGYVRKLNAALDGLTLANDGSLESLLQGVSAEDALAILEKDDIAVTNKSDKANQLKKITKLDEQVKEYYKSRSTPDAGK